MDRAGKRNAQVVARRASRDAKAAEIYARVARG